MLAVPSGRRRSSQPPTSSPLPRQPQSEAPRWSMDRPLRRSALDRLPHARQSGLPREPAEAPGQLLVFAGKMRLGILQKRGPPLVPSAHAGMYRDFVVSVFAGRHRLVRDTLRALVGWQRARRVVAGLGLDPAATPWEVSFACWLDLFELFKAAARQRMPSGVAGAERRLLRQQRRLRKPHRTSSWSSSRTVIECRPPPLTVGDSASPILPRGCRAVGLRGTARPIVVVGPMDRSW